VVRAFWLSIQHVGHPWQTHGMVEVSSIVLFAGDSGRAAAFYTALGVPLEAEDHGDGPEHLAADLNGIHFAIFQADGVMGRAPERRHAGSDFPGFYVVSLDDVVGALRALGSSILTDHERRPRGCRAIAVDPDGRAVEINQRDHCPG
jgi:predicted enzyme related to lactoylglutathione lyase